jgi:hypothetical protein
VRKLYIFMRLLDLYTRCSFVMEEISLQVVGGAGGNRLLAGYLAHEFLRRSTLLGERRLQPSGRKEKEPALAVPAPEPSRRYAEVSRLLMAVGARIPGVVNPSQLGRRLRIKE